QDPEFVLSHCDNVQASGFVEHLKLPHYVDFQAELALLRQLRAECLLARGATCEASEPAPDRRGEAARWRRRRPTTSPISLNKPSAPSGAPSSRRSPFRATRCRSPAAKCRCRSAGAPAVCK